MKYQSVLFLIAAATIASAAVADPHVVSPGVGAVSPNDPNDQKKDQVDTTCGSETQMCCTSLGPPTDPDIQAALQKAGVSVPSNVLAGIGCDKAGQGSKCNRVLGCCTDEYTNGVYTNCSKK